MKQLNLLTAAIVSTLTLSLHAQANGIQALYTNAQAQGLSAHVLTEALNSYNWAKAHGDVNNPNVLTVIDYSKPSTDKRLWVLDLKNHRVLMHTLVAHGSGSGALYADHFSNRFHSHATSLGVFTTSLRPYYGKHGRSLRMHGLESGINNNAFPRAIEIHGANYVSQQFIKYTGRLGRTWGCFGVSLNKVTKVVNYTVGGSVVFAYASPENNDPIATEGVASVQYALNTHQDNKA